MSLWNGGKLRHSSPRASVKCRLGPLSAGLDLFVFFFKCRLGGLSAGFGVLTAVFFFSEKKRKKMKKQKKDEKNARNKDEKKIKIPRKGCPSCALNDTNLWKGLDWKTGGTLF